MSYSKKTKKSMEFLEEAKTMDQCTHEVRLQYWKNIISQCQARPEGQSAKQWLADNGICEQTYYLWQRKIRRSAYELMQTTHSDLVEPKEQSKISFAEIPIPHLHSTMEAASVEACIRPVAVIRTGSCSIAIAADIPETILAQILKEVSHA